MASPSTAGLFEAFNSPKLQLGNRLVMAPMTRYFSPDYMPCDQAAAYYSRRVLGGVGLVITEATIIDEPHATAYENVPGMFGEQALSAWRQVVDAVHDAGGKIFSQLWHTGAIRKPGVGPDPALTAISPSGLLMPGVHSGRVMTTTDIERVIGSFARAAHTAIELGFDGIELHGAHGYLIDQFLWAGSNTRTDVYGGSIAARARFAVELVQAVRTSVGPSIPISFRFSQWKQQDYSARLVETPQQLAELLEPLSLAGVDLFHASTRRFWEPEFDQSPLNLAGWARKLTGKPAITVGGVCLDSDFLDSSGSYEKRMQEFELSHSASQEELLTAVGDLMSTSADAAGLHGLTERLEDGEFDLVAIGRALLANPDLPQRIRCCEWDQVRPYDSAVLETLV